MKKLLSLAVLGAYLYASEMPPMPPGMGGKSAKKSIQSGIKACDSIPPMIYILPPPLEAELKDCKDEFFKPKIELAQMALSKIVEGIEINDLKPLPQYDMLYKIQHNKKINILCNKSITSCIIDGKVIDLK
jgi:hypothetical protein